MPPNGIQELENLKASAKAAHQGSQVGAAKIHVTAEIILNGRVMETSLFTVDDEHRAFEHPEPSTESSHVVG